MLAGSRAAIIEDRNDAYLVKSPLDGSVGWVSRIQVSRALWQDVNTREECTPRR